MKIAISTDMGYVSAHFGRCPEFTIVDIENGKVTKKETIDNPGHHPGYLPEFLKGKEVECIVAGGMGVRAQGLFEQAGIKMVLGVEGEVDDVVERLAAGKLKSGQSMCSPGGGKGYGVSRSNALIDGKEYSAEHGEHHSHHEGDDE